MSEATKFSFSPTPMSAGSGSRQHEAVRVLAPHHCERVRAAQLGDGLLHGLEEVLGSAEVMMNAVRDHFGVGVRGEFVAELPRARRAAPRGSR